MYERSPDVAWGRAMEPQRGPATLAALGAAVMAFCIVIVGCEEPGRQSPAVSGMGIATVSERESGWPGEPLVEPAQPSNEPPEIVQVGTYQQGMYVYFSLLYKDSNGNAEGFGFRGTRGSGWAEESHPFSNPSYGRVYPGRVDYPFNLECGTAYEYESDVEAWIYDTAGLQSRPVVIHLTCTGSQGAK